MIKKKIAVLIDLELSKKSGGHVKFWEKNMRINKTISIRY